SPWPTRRCPRGERQKHLPIVHLAAHQFQAAPGDAIGLAGLGLDRLFCLELVEDEWRETTHQPAVAAEELEIDDLAAFVLDGRNTAALREGVQHPLFVPGNIHGNV